MPVLVAEELDLLDAQNASGGSLFLLANRDKLGVLLLRVFPALRAVGDDHVVDASAALGQLRDRTAGAEVRVVRVRGHDEHAVELR
jgi:hypothetical protein